MATNPTVAINMKRCQRAHGAPIDRRDALVVWPNCLCYDPVPELVRGDAKTATASRA